MKKITSITNPSKKKINGPINVLRLEGTVGKIKKVVYLFMDYHMPVGSETQCSHVFAEDVHRYFAKSFYRLSGNDKIYDFFVEVFPSELVRKITSKTEFKDIYIEEVVKFFRKIFVYNSKRNKVLINDLFKNIRLHYVDIRDYYKKNLLDMIDKMELMANEFMCQQYINLDSLHKIIEILHILKQHLELVIDIITRKIWKEPAKIKVISPQKYSINIDALTYIANKMSRSYKNKFVKDRMNQLMKQSVKEFSSIIRMLDDSIERFGRYAEYLKKSENILVRDDNTIYLYTYGPSSYNIRRMIVDIVDTVEILINELIEYFGRFMDIYFLRRFLDKDYITNVIAYTGALHSNTYVHELVKYFNFKVTHASYFRGKNMDELNKEIKKRSMMEIQELILPHKLEQCSDMSHFPEDFL
ncbi:MAG: hypothetical protein QW303_03730 [Nitrososphaerota archaeon]